MKLFKMEVHTSKGRVYDVLAHAATADAAREHVQLRFTACEIRDCIELPEIPKHFVLAELEDEPED